MHIFNARSHFLTSTGYTQELVSSASKRDTTEQEKNKKTASNLQNSEIYNSENNNKKDADLSESIEINYQNQSTREISQIRSSKPELNSKHDPNDESWAISMLKEMGEEVEELEAEQRRRLKPSKASAESSKHKNVFSTRFIDISHEDLHDIDENYINHKPRQHTIWYVLLALFGVLGLVLQYLYTNMENLSGDERFRRVLIPLCEYSGCRLPPFIDIEKLKLNNHAVRLDESNAGQLAVDAVITNKAAFEQPFPTLKITFKTRDEQLVAERLFKPSDYLGPEIKLESMPPEKPIHVSVRMSDPGENAVNYHFSFLAPPQEGL